MKKGALLFIVMSMMLWGCGSGDDDNDGTASSGGEVATKAEFIKLANAICAKAEKAKTAALETELSQRQESGPGKSVQEELVTEVALPPIDRMTEELGELSPPEGEEAKVEEVVAAYEQAIEEVSSDPSKALTAPPFAVPDRMAGQYGLKSCSVI